MADHDAQEPGHSGPGQSIRNKNKPVSTNLQRSEGTPVTKAVPVCAVLHALSSQRREYSLVMEQRGWQQHRKQQGPSEKGTKEPESEMREE